MTLLSLIPYFVFGLIVGSFINVVVLRSGARALVGRSGCMSCGAPIRWFDLIPVFSWLYLRGRCRSCGSRISAQYPLMEAGMGVSFALVGGALLSPLSTVLALLICATLIAIVVYDIRHTIIPDAWVWSFNVLALLFVLAFPLPATSYWLPALLSGPAVALPLFALWLVSKGTWMGLGDAKLALGIGWLLGPLYGIEAVLLAFIIGAIVGLLLIFFSSEVWKRFIQRFIHHRSWRMSGDGITMKSEIPFGPFLVAAFMFQWISAMYGISIPFLWQ